MLISEEKKDGFEMGTDQAAMSSENLVGKGTLWQSIRALIVKRFHIYKRDKCGLCCELIVPVILVLFGLGLLQIPFLKNSEEFTLDTSAYPSPQRMLFNTENYMQTTNEYTPADLVANLPNQPYWSISYN